MNIKDYSKKTLKIPTKIDIDSSAYINSEMAKKVADITNLYSPLKFILIFVGLLLLILILPVVIFDFNWSEVLFFSLLTIFPSFLLAISLMLLILFKLLQKRTLKLSDLISEIYLQILSTELTSNENNTQKYANQILRLVIVDVVTSVINRRLILIPFVGGMLAKFINKIVENISVKVKLPQHKLNLSVLNEFVSKTNIKLTKVIKAEFKSAINIVTIVSVFLMSLSLIFVLLIQTIF